MPDMPASYYNTFDLSKNYEALLFRDGYTLQGAELNSLQSAARHRLKDVADALFKDGDIIRDAVISVDKNTGTVKAGSGAVYLKGAVRGIPSAEFSIPITGSIAVGVRLTESVISELEDPALYNPAIGSRGEGEPGAWRLRVEPQWSFDGDGNAGEFYPVYVVDNGEIRAKEAPPTMDALTQGIARYDRDSTAGGSYVVAGLSVLQAADGADGGQVYTVTEGRARVNGYGVDIPTSRRLTYAAIPDLRLIDTEVHIADATSTQAGGQRISLAHPPLHHVDVLRITTRKTVTLTHGAYMGAQDAMPDTAVTGIVECRQGETVYLPGVDYKKTGDKVDWSLAGNEPATGSTFICTYDHIITVSPVDADYDGFTVVGAVNGSSILVTYQQALPRIDRLALTQEGQTQWFQGVAAEVNARPPSVPAHLLPLASVHQSWRDTRSVVNDGVRVVPFDEIVSINNRIDYALREIARQRLEADVFTREAGARVGMFVDPLLDDSCRDQGIPQTAAIANGEMTLPISVISQTLGPDGPRVAAFSPSVILMQPWRTGDMKVNPYMAFGVIPAKVTLVPPLDQWTEVQSVWTSAIWSSVWGGTQVLSSQTTNIEHLRQIAVRFSVTGFGPGEQLREVTFDGIPVEFSPAVIVADGQGALSGSFVIPPHIPAGAKTVTFRGLENGGSFGQGVFIGQGKLTVQVLRQVYYSPPSDPLAQTFTLDVSSQICGVDLWFTSRAGDVRVQLREAQNGVPVGVILGEVVTAPEDIVIAGGGHTRMLFSAPVQLLAGIEYALVILCNDALTSVAVAEMGKFDTLARQWVTSQPYTVGVLLSSSNANSWTAHQDRDLAFRLLEAKFSVNTTEVDMGIVEVVNATDMIAFAVEDTPTAATRIEYQFMLPDGSSLTLAQGQPIRLAEPVSGEIAVKAILTGTANASPVLWPGVQILTGTVADTADYYSRSVPATGATKAVLIFDAIIPSGATVTPEIRMNDGEWESLAADGATQQGDGLVEFRFRKALDNVDEIKARLLLGGNSASRPVVRNIRMMAVI